MIDIMPAVQIVLIKTVNRGRRVPSIFLKEKKRQSKTTTVINGIRFFKSAYINIFPYSPNTGSPAIL